MRDVGASLPTSTGGSQGETDAELVGRISPLLPRGPVPAEHRRDSIIANGRVVLEATSPLPGVQRSKLPLPPPASAAAVVAGTCWAPEG